MRLTMNNLERCFDGAKKENATWVAVVVKAPNCESSELILNPNVNFDTKLEYYKKAYDFELNLKSCKDIKIVGFTFGDTLAEIEDYLFSDDEEVEDQCPCMKEPSYNCGMKCSRCGREL